MNFLSNTGFPHSDAGMIFAAILGGLAASVIILLFLLIYMKYKRPGKGYLRMSPTTLSLEQKRRDSRASSIFNIHGQPSVQENGKVPDFDIPLLLNRTDTVRPKRTCQLHFSLFYNFHLNELTVQVLQAQSLPKLFGLQSGVLVKVCGRTAERLVYRARNVTDLMQAA